MLVDRAKVHVIAGNGGRGSVSFRREKFVPKGGPDGGDGGRGGDIILKADSHTDNLTSLFYEPILKARSGGHGMGKKMHGRSAPDKIVKVPIGTVVYRTEAPKPRHDDLDEQGTEVSGNEEQMNPASVDSAPAPSAEPMADLTADGQEFVLAKGGK